MCFVQNEADFEVSERLFTSYHTRAILDRLEMWIYNRDYHLCYVVRKRSSDWVLAVNGDDF